MILGKCFSPTTPFVLEINILEASTEVLNLLIWILHWMKQ